MFKEVRRRSSTLYNQGSKPPKAMNEELQLTVKIEICKKGKYNVNMQKCVEKGKK